MSNSYIPPQRILSRYADVLVNFALNSGKGVNPGEVVQIVVPDVAKPLALELQNTILRAGAHPMLRLQPTGFSSDFYRYANENQLKFFPEEYWRARVDLIDHQIAIIADVDPLELANVPPQKIFLQRNSSKKIRDWLNEKEVNNKYTWTIALWATPAKAAEVGLSLEDYWKQIIKACFLDKADPLVSWREVQTLQQDLLGKLNQLDLSHVHVSGEDMDLTIKIGEQRKWLGGSGRNIPSFEFFTSPDWRGTSGWIRFNQPLYRYGHIIEGIELEFKRGKVVGHKATKGKKLLTEMLKTPNADKVGEFSLTDKRLSRINHVMAETLYDENFGGLYGNTHIALGMAYKDTYKGDASKLKTADWKNLGFNDSAEHTDIISTNSRKVIAKLRSGKEFLLYENGLFKI